MQRLARSPYIVGRAYDWAFFLLPPVLCLVLGIAVSNSWLVTEDWEINGERDSVIGFALGTIIHAHLVAVL
ncbi:MAG TPA: hypothetical protein VIU61_15155, partial [Kofleriaceae bacterium]